MSSNRARKKIDDGQLAFDLEQLEDRQMLAGDVSVFLSDGTLHLEGDNASNRVQIVSDGLTTTISGQGTSINGDSDSVSFSNDLIYNFNIHMDDGNDQLTMIAENEFGTGFSSNFSSYISMGDGNDRVQMIANNSSGRGFAADYWEIFTGRGNDRIEFEANNDLSDLPLEGDGESSFGFDISQMYIGTSSDNDRVSFEANNGEFTGGYRFSYLNVQTSSGNDRVEFSADNTGESVGFSIGQEFNDPEVSANNFSNNGWNINTSSGNDRVNIEANNSSSFGTGYDIFEFDFSTGSGNDRVDMTVANEGGDDSVGLQAFYGSIDTGPDFENLGEEESDESDRDRVSITARNSGLTGMLIRNNFEIETGSDRDQVDISARNRGGTTGFEIGVNPGSLTEGGDIGLEIYTESDNDRVGISARNNGNGSRGLVTSFLNLGTSNGDDRVQIRAQNRGTESEGIIAFEYANIYLSSGQDDLQISARDENGLRIDNGTFDGGSGEQDRLRSNTSLGNIDIYDFEDAPEQDEDM